MKEVEKKRVSEHGGVERIGGMVSKTGITKWDRSMTFTAPFRLEGQQYVFEFKMQFLSLCCIF